MNNDIDEQMSAKSQHMSEVMREKHATDPIYHEQICEHLAFCNAQRAKTAEHEHKLDEAVERSTYVERMQLKDEVLSDNLARGRIQKFFTAVEQDRIAFLTQDIFDITDWLRKQPYTRATEIKLNVLRDNAKKRADYFLRHHCISSAPTLFPKEL